jgi:hypothetical protein
VQSRGEGVPLPAQVPMHLQCIPAHAEASATDPRSPNSPRRRNLSPTLPPSPPKRQRPLGLGEENLTAALQNPSHVGKRFEIKPRHLDGTGERIQIRRPAASALDDLAG